MLIGNSASEKVKNSQKLNSKSVSFGVDQAPANSSQAVFNTIKVNPPVQVQPTVITPKPVASTAATPQIPLQPKKDTYTPQQNTTKPEESKKVGSYLTIGLAAAATAMSAIGLAISVKSSRKFKNTPSTEDVKELLKPLGQKIDDAIGTFTNNQKASEDKANEALKAAKKMNLLTKIGIGAIGGIGVTEAVSMYKSEFSDSDGKLEEIDEKELEAATTAGQTAKKEINEAKEAASSALAKTSGNEALTSYTQPVMGYNLLAKVDEKFKRTEDYEKAIIKIQQAANLKISPPTEKEVAELHLPKPPQNDLKVTDTIWSVTSEFDPIKEGGLGVVPVHVQRNFNQKLNIDLPTFIPMYLNNGTASFKEEKVMEKVEGSDKLEEKTRYTYTYGNNKDGVKGKGDSFKLKKVMSYEVNAFRNGKQTRENVELYETTSPQTKGKVYFIKNEDYFGNSSVYGNNVKAHEKEKFAFFSKAVYDLAKFKLDSRSLNDVKVYDSEALENLKAPEGMLLNDWQAAPVAAMARYSAPLESAHRELDSAVADKLYNMKIITVGHNATYQGNSCDKHVCENVLNTLFEDFTADIVKNAKVDLTDDTEGLFKNVTVLKEGKHEEGKCEQGINMLNMGIALSDYFCPVSKNYAKELVSDPNRSGDLQTILKAREGNTLIGVLNGNDRDNIGPSREGCYNGITGTKFKKDAYGEDIKDDKGKKIVESIKYPEFVPYSYKDDKQTIIDARKINRNIYLTKVLKEGVENTPGNVEKAESSFFAKNLRGKTEMPDLTNIENIPVFSYGGRAVSQKGLDILARTIKNTYADWDNNFKGKEKPIFIIAASDGGEGPKMKKILGELKKDLKPDEYNRVIIFYGAWDGFKATQAFTDFGLIPSWFEPCGLIQSEIQALGGIPVATNTGGLPNTIYDPEVDKNNVNGHKGQTGYLTPIHYSDDKTKLEENAAEFTKLINRCSRDFFASKDPYYDVDANNPDQKQITPEMAEKAKNKLTDMSYNAMQVDHSWIRPGKNGNMEGPAFDYLKLFGMKDIDIQNAYNKVHNLPLIKETVVEKTEPASTENVAEETTKANEVANAEEVIKKQDASEEVKS